MQLLNFERDKTFYVDQLESLGEERVEKLLGKDTLENCLRAKEMYLLKEGDRVGLYRRDKVFPVRLAVIQRVDEFHIILNGQKYHRLFGFPIGGGTEIIGPVTEEYKYWTAKRVVNNFAEELREVYNLKISKEKILKIALAITDEEA